MKILRCTFLNKQTNEVTHRVVRETEKKWVKALSEIHAEYDEVGEHGTLHIEFEEV